MLENQLLQTYLEEFVLDKQQILNWKHITFLKQRLNIIIPGKHEEFLDVSKSGPLKQCSAALVLPTTLTPSYYFRNIYVYFKNLSPQDNQQKKPFVDV